MWGSRPAFRLQQRLCSCPRRQRPGALHSNGSRTLARPLPPSSSRLSGRPVHWLQRGDSAAATETEPPLCPFPRNRNGTCICFQHWGSSSLRQIHFSPAPPPVCLLCPYSTNDTHTTALHSQFRPGEFLELVHIQAAFSSQVSSRQRKSLPLSSPHLGEASCWHRQGWQF